jgi:hypothetical protein
MRFDVVQARGTMVLILLPARKGRGRSVPMFSENPDGAADKTLSTDKTDPLSDILCDVPNERKPPPTWRVPTTPGSRIRTDWPVRHA